MREPHYRIPSCVHEFFSLAEPIELICYLSSFNLAGIRD